MPQRLAVYLHVHNRSVAANRARVNAAATCTDPQAYNDPDQPPKVVIEEQPARAGSRLSVAPCSATVFPFEAE
jgi:hypothetical protein